MENYSPYYPQNVYSVNTAIVEKVEPEIIDDERYFSIILNEKALNGTLMQ
jgi:hypothetical protein